MDYSSDLGKHICNQCPHQLNIKRRVRLQHSLEEIAKYQKIKEEDMQVALEVCGKDIGAEGRVGCELLLLFEKKGPERFERKTFRI